ncbi:SLAC1 anion channel family protein [Pandoraea sp. ISTKB]|uniref:SLAC1 anion channel family protein n=1 Tax=Pandoraea sp. ISTKB TaxID=1586708 RepID=UPI00084641B7|nr:SLAC1 anion channel family protein [Pandoraea sp. ISTKB]ODP35524.1 C4-dicarboxylate ABC transporter [Pandoraea sp. ISTKB]
MTTHAQVQIAATPTTLSQLPVAFFGSVMGLTGLSVAWRLAHVQFGAASWVGEAIGAVALALFAALVVAYLAKAVLHFDRVRAEFSHPIAGNMFGTPLISLLLTPLLLADSHPGLARGLWYAGAIGMLVLAWWMVMRWISVRQQPEHATPAWIVPVVGLLDVPLAVPALGLSHEMHGLMVFGTAVGLFFAVPLFTMIVSRLMFAEPFPASLQPSLLILVAPFSVGFSAYTATVGSIDGFAQALYMIMLFVLAVLLVRLRGLAHCCPFRVSWWSVSFPLAASAATAVKYAGFAQHPVTDTVAIALLGLATLVIAALFVRTAWGVARGELRTLTS